MLSGYAVDKLVSTGKRGALYQARQMSLDRTVTIKVLPPEIRQDPVLRQAFETEAKAMARLNDPNLVDVFDFGEVQDTLYIIMEHVPGRSLFETTHGKHVDPKESLRLVADLCHGLDHAHQAGMIHRALNPKNVLINNEAQAKIVNFGIASLTGINNSDEVSGYTAPELRTTDSQAAPQVDARADIYSAGMILYELIVGRLPSNPYTPPSAVRNTRRELDEIIYHAIQPDPAQRYSSAKEMAQELENALEKMGTPPTQQIIKTMLTAGTATATTQAPRRPTVNIPVTKPANHSALIVTLLTIAVLIGVAALVIKSSSNTPQPKAPPTANQKPKTAPKVRSHEQSPPRLSNADKISRREKRERNLANNRNKTPIIEAPKPEPQDGGNTETAEITPLVTPAPELPDKATPPEFDIDEWLLTARTFMHKKAQRTLADYDKEIASNIDSFERDVKRRIRRLDRSARNPAEAAAEALFITYRANGRLADDAGKDTPKQIKDIYKLALADQEEIDNEFLIPLTKFRITYTQGINQQITILSDQGNDEHAATLREEVSEVESDMAYFTRILRDPEAEPALELELAPKKAGKQ